MTTGMRLPTGCGGASLAAAIALNRSTLARGSTYRAVPLPIGPTPLR